jgi:molecular chaperone GrpE
MTEDAPDMIPTDAPANAGEARMAAEPAAAASDTLAEERDRFYDLLLRKTAEFDNYRKRTDRERGEQRERAAGDVILEVLPIIDDLERALSGDPVSEQVAAYRVGIALIHAQLVDLLKRRGVTPVDSVGTDFDPNVHQAVTAEHAEGRRDGEVIEELRRGYRLGDRLLRPAMVKVARS